MSQIQIERLSKSYGAAAKALDAVSLRVEAGSMVGLIGASGSGKSTLLRHVSGLVRADGGAGSTVTVSGQCVQSGGKLSRNLRGTRARIGVIFQQFNLVGRLSVLTNVLAGSLGRAPVWRGTLMAFTEAERMLALRALERVGILDHAHKRAADLSGGQQQRAAIARALVQQAEVILADEPIASLDPESARRVMDTLAQINREDGTTVVVSLHQVDFALRYCSRIVALRHGRIVYDGPAAGVDAEVLREVYGMAPEEGTGLSSWRDNVPAFLPESNAVASMEVA